MPAGRDLMFNVVYWSNAARPFTDGELFEMLAHWREKNERFGITGLLLYKEGAFIQTLEGEEARVRALYAAIRADERHYDIFTIQAQTIPRRHFPGWSMGFKRFAGVDAASVPGYNLHPSLPASAAEGASNSTLAMQLLAHFAREIG